MVVIRVDEVEGAIRRWVLLARDRREQLTGCDEDKAWYACQVRDGRYLRFRNDGKVEVRGEDYYTLLSIIE